MKFAPITRDEWLSSGGSFLKADDCDFVVIDCEENVSQAGNEQFKITLQCSQGATSGNVKDWIGKADNMRWKLIQFSKAIADDQIRECIQRGELTAKDIKNKTGRAKLRKRKDSDYMEIHYYIEKQANDEVIAPAPESEPFDDDIPF